MNRIKITVTEDDANNLLCPITAAVRRATGKNQVFVGKYIYVTEGEVKHEYEYPDKVKEALDQYDSRYPQFEWWMLNEYSFFLGDKLTFISDHL